jgi:RimJ/RimL family protein N-acetyltransferase
MPPSPALPGPAYRIHTQRLVIRCWHPADASLLQAAIDESLNHLRPWLPWALHEPEDVQAKVQLLRTFRGKFDMGQDFYYGIFNRSETRVLGGTGLHMRLGDGAREIGYWIHVAHINQGLATEVSAALTRVAFEVDHVRRVEIHCDPSNLRSAAVPRKLGYVHEATLRQRLPLPTGQFRDVMIWSLLAADYPTTPAATATLQAFDAASAPLC